MAWSLKTRRWRQQAATGLISPISVICALSVNVANALTDGRT
ncbi:MAG: hypothetical protein ABL932_25630 [Terricaulis sp.]